MVALAADIKHRELFSEHTPDDQRTFDCVAIALEAVGGDLISTRSTPRTASGARFPWGNHRTAQIRLIRLEGNLPSIAPMKLSHWRKTLGDTVRLSRSVRHELGSPGVKAIPTAGWHNACFGAQNESECEGSLFCPVRWGFLPPLGKTLPLSIYRFRRGSPFEKRIIFCPHSGGLSPASSRNRRNAGVLICELMTPAQARRMLFAVYPRVYAGTMLLGRVV